MVYSMVHVRYTIVWYGHSVPCPYYAILSLLITFDGFLCFDIYIRENFHFVMCNSPNYCNCNNGV